MKLNELFDVISSGLMAGAFEEAGHEKVGLGCWRSSLLRVCEGKVYYFEVFWDMTFREAPTVLVPPVLVVGKVDLAEGAELTPSYFRGPLPVQWNTLRPDDDARGSDFDEYREAFPEVADEMTDVYASHIR